MPFPSFISTVCAVLGAPFASSAFFASSVAGFTTNVFLSSVSFRARFFHRSFVAVYCTFTLVSSEIRLRLRYSIISPKLVEQIHLGEYIDFAELLPDSLRDNEPPRELMLEHQHLVIPMSPPRREVRDIISWIDCWIAYCQVVLTFGPSRSAELLKYLDLIGRTHRSFPNEDVWLHYDWGFWRKAACSPVPLDWGPLTWKFSTNPTQAAKCFSQPPSRSFRRSGELHREAKPRAPLSRRNLPHLEQRSLH